MALIYYCRIYLNYQHMTIWWQFVIDKPLLPFSDAARIGRSKGTFTISYLKLIFEWYIEYQCLTIESTNVLLFRVNVVEYFLLDERLLVLERRTRWHVQVNSLNVLKSTPSYFHMLLFISHTKIVWFILLAKLCKILKFKRRKKISIYLKPVFQI